MGRCSSIKWKRIAARCSFGDYHLPEIWDSHGMKTCAPRMQTTRLKEVVWTLCGTERFRANQFLSKYSPHFCWKNTWTTGKWEETSHLQIFPMNFYSGSLRGSTTPAPQTATLKHTVVLWGLLASCWNQSTRAGLACSHISSGSGTPLPWEAQHLHCLWV